MEFTYKTSAEFSAMTEEERNKYATDKKKHEDAERAKELEAKTKEIEERFEARIKVVQDHADKLDLKLQKGEKTPQPGATFASVIKEGLENATDDIEKFKRKEVKNFAIELKAVGDVSTANVTGGSRYGQVFAPGIRQNQSRKVHLEYILPGGTIGAGNTFTFMRENGAGEGSIAPVSEGAMKPQFDVDLVEATVNVETIAGWMRVTRKAMENIPGFISFLQARLPEKFKNVLDNQILYGTGVTPNLKGILTAGNFVASTALASQVLIDKIITDISVLEDTYERDATDILLRPAHYYSLFQNKALGSGEYDLPEGVTFVNGQLYVFGIPAHKTTALTATDYVVGDFDMGAQLLTQDAMRIEFFEQDGTNVRENKVTIRIEGNYALPVYGPDYFIKGTSTYTPPEE